MAIDLTRVESRVLPMLTIIALIALLHSLPNRYALLPGWAGYALGAILIASMLGTQLALATYWSTVERVAVGLFVAVGSMAELVALQAMIADIIFHRKQISPITLLTTSIAIWVTNVLIFAFVYWQMDRGGPEGRARGFHGKADLTFAHGDPSDRMPADWRPTFADYLFLGYNTSTAFSPTDTLPLTTRAKMLMMAQSTVSLVTLVVVAARAINILT
jgi:hypothetical protein